MCHRGPAQVGLGLGLGLGLGFAAGAAEVLPALLAIILALDPGDAALGAEVVALVGTIHGGMDVGARLQAASEHIDGLEITTTQQPQKTERVRNSCRTSTKAFRPNSRGVRRDTHVVRRRNEHLMIGRAQR